MTFTLPWLLLAFVAGALAGLVSGLLINHPMSEEKARKLLNRRD